MEQSIIQSKAKAYFEEIREARMEVYRQLCVLEDAQTGDEESRKKIQALRISLDLLDELGSMVAKIAKNG